MPSMFVQRVQLAREALSVPLVSAYASASAISSVGRAADRVFIMGYDFHGPGSAIPGPVAPLLNGPKTVADAVARYARLVPAGKLILGVPAYGYSWPIVRAATPSRVQANVARYGGVRGCLLYTSDAADDLL